MEELEEVEEDLMMIGGRDSEVEPEGEVLSIGVRILGEEILEVSLEETSEEAEVTSGKTAVGITETISEVVIGEEIEVEKEDSIGQVTEEAIDQATEEAIDQETEEVTEVVEEETTEVNTEMADGETTTGVVETNSG
mmetsp:Transcript_46385/g.34072  ORF Transcript_46385/g.34072 Transcript_46385/m.34072 type:complete len:137 (+) Transcript_46385:1077-1487(+)